MWRPGTRNWRPETLRPKGSVRQSLWARGPGSARAQQFVAPVYKLHLRRQGIYPLKFRSTPIAYLCSIRGSFLILTSRRVLQSLLRRMKDPGGLLPLTLSATMGMSVPHKLIVCNDFQSFMSLGRNIFECHELLRLFRYLTSSSCPDGSTSSPEMSCPGTAF